MKFDNILFYNFAHSGDIHVSRSLVKYVVDNIPAQHFSYWHPRASNILDDINNLQYVSAMSGPENIMKCGWFVYENTLMCNTWYHSFNSQEYKGCTIQTLFNIFNRGLQEMLDQDLPGNPIDYLPEINFDNFFQGGQESKIIDRLRSMAPIHRVLIANCDVLSNQSENFDFNPIISYLAKSFPSCYFIISNVQKSRIPLPNVCYAEDIIKKNYDNLNEIAYLSYFCDIVIGRASGPYTFSLIKRNLLDEKKTFICFSNENFGIIDKVKAKTIVSEDYSETNVISTIENAIIERFLLW